MHTKSQPFLSLIPLANSFVSTAAQGPVLWDTKNHKFTGELGVFPKPALKFTNSPSPSQTMALKHQLNSAHSLESYKLSKEKSQETKTLEELLMPFMLLELLGEEMVILAFGWILKRGESHRLLSKLKSFSFSFFSFMFPSLLPTSPSSPKLLVEIWKAAHELLRSWQELIKWSSFILKWTHYHASCQ